jgi:alkylated DNA nucleotide flippase Atl1
LDRGDDDRSRRRARQMIGILSEARQSAQALRITNDDELPRLRVLG